VILVGIGIVVGTQVKVKAQRDTTIATLKVLQSAMSDFLKDNREPTATNWVPALRSDARTAKALEGLKPTATGILDGFGNPITFVPSAGGKPALFVSPGRDGKLGNVNSQPADADSADNIFSDPIAVNP
jgi:hypothetical protein